MKLECCVGEREKMGVGCVGEREGQRERQEGLFLGGGERGRKKVILCSVGIY